MKKILGLTVFGAVFSWGSLVAAEPAGPEGACTPSYEFTYSPCKARPSGKMIPVRGDRRVGNDGACDPTDAEAAELCRQDARGRMQILSEHPFLEEKALRYRHKAEEKKDEKCGFEANGKGGQFFAKLKPKKMVYCIYDYDYPEIEYYADNSCPLSDIKDKNNCFAGETVDISAEGIDSCLKLNPAAAGPKVQEQRMEKAFCLFNIFDAANSGKLDTGKLTDDQRIYLPQWYDLVWNSDVPAYRNVVALLKRKLNVK